MSTRFLNPGAMVCDSAGRPNPLAMHEAGVSGMSVYGGHGRYNVDMVYILQLWSAGIVVLCNHENVGTEARQGYDRGVVDANEALVFFREMGWKNETPILFSATDFDVQPREYMTCDGYYEAVRNVMAEGDSKWGPYAKSGYIDHMVETALFPTMYPWQAGGWRYGHDSPWAYLRQNYVVGKNDDGSDQWAYNLDTSTFGATVDLNMVYKTFPAWGPEKGPSVNYPLFVESGGAVIVSSEPAVWHAITGAEFYGLMGKALEDADVVHVNPDDFNQLASTIR